MNDPLLECLYKTHYLAAKRPSASTAVLQAAWDSNGNDLIKSIAAAMMTFGGAHAPIKDVFELLEGFEGGLFKDIKILDCFDKVPGFGSSFVKLQADPMLDDLNKELLKETKLYRNYAGLIIDYLINERFENIYPNLAFYTAAVAHHRKLNINFCEVIMIKARIASWINILLER